MKGVSKKGYAETDRIVGRKEGILSKLLRGGDIWGIWYTVMNEKLEGVLVSTDGHMRRRAQLGTKKVFQQSV